MSIDIAGEVAQLQGWYKSTLPTIKEVFNESEQSKLERVVSEKIPVRLEEAGSSMQLCHGDLTSWNMIYLEGGQVGIIDFGKACHCDASKDLIYFGDEVIAEYCLNAYGDTSLLRKRIEARALLPEITSLMYYSGKGIQSGVEKTAARIKWLLA